LEDGERSERWRRVERLYHDALELPPAERTAFLRDACGSDARLRQEVEALISVAPDAEHFLEPQRVAIVSDVHVTAGALAGCQVGPYLVTSLLGAGGMGEVYRATDARLGRDVAMKVLSVAARTSSDRLRRFEQEARAAATLSHPNILAVFDVGTHDGTPYLISELLEGETLRDRLHDGALPVRRAIDYAVQIATGLAAAHDKGIVHRDVKPENVFITIDGRVKILDFGVAKLVEDHRGHGRQPGAGSPLAGDRDGTTPGMVIGTVGYMSPEQVRGLRVDHRNDIFSFGAVLLEMITGRRAFERETTADTLSAILDAEPPAAGPADAPAAARALHVARRCLEKSPAARFQRRLTAALRMRTCRLGSPSMPGRCRLMKRFRRRRPLRQRR